MKYNRLSKINRSFISSYERNLWVALPNFQRLQERLNLPDIVTTDALHIYIKAVKERLTLGRSIDMLLLASIYISLRIHNIPKSIEELIPLSYTTKRHVVRAYRILVMEILPKLKFHLSRIGPIPYVNKFGEELQISIEIRNHAIELLKGAEKKGLLNDGKDPKGLAAAALYLAGKIRKKIRTQTEIAIISHVSEVTLRMRTRELIKYNHILNI
jgi:transcription initiation factor TFIIB